MDEELKEKVYHILDVAEYELNDGIGLGGYRRKFNTDEYELIEAVISFIRRKVEEE